VAERLIGEMRTPDGYWRVQVYQAGRNPQWYRVIHGTTIVHEKAPIGTVQHILGDAYADLVVTEPGEVA
jgi:hypothetical protein